MPLSSHVIDILAASGSGSSSKGGGSSLLSFLPLLLIVAVGYLLLVRPARTRQRKALENRSAVEPGVEVTTTAGLIATVVEVDDDTVTLEVAPGVHSRYLKGAIARVHTPVEPTFDEAGYAAGSATGSADAPAQESIPESAPPVNPVEPGSTSPDQTER